MSLILDALRKAESDRQRGAVPGLHGPAALPPVARDSRSRVGWMVALFLLLGAMAAWVWHSRPVAPLSAATPPVPARLPAATVPPAAPATLPLVVSAPPPAAPGPRGHETVRAEPVEAPVTTGASTGSARTAGSAHLNAGEAPSPAQPRATSAPTPIVTQVRRLADLPPEQRRELPPLAVSGSVWSEQATARFIVLDGQVLREGERAAPGLVLVKLAPRAATLRWRGELIELPF